MSPYPSMMVDTRFYKMVKGGYHMSRPDFAPPEMYVSRQMLKTICCIAYYMSRDSIEFTGFFSIGPNLHHSYSKPTPPFLNKYKESSKS